MREKSPAVYILANKPRGAIYVGVTGALWNRVAIHKDGKVPGFTLKYDIKCLVWYEHHHSMESAIRREKQIKEWKRKWKDELIEKFNLQWRELHDEIDVNATLVAYQPDKDSGFRRNDEF